jgi:hypothetical protein
MRQLSFRLWRVAGPAWVTSWRTFASATNDSLADVRPKKAGELLHTPMLFLRLVTHDVSSATLEHLVDDGL